MIYEIHPELDKILDRLSKKNKELFETLMNKIEEIVNSLNLDHYKNLRKPLQKYKRVHIGSFVLLFFVKNDVLIFRYFDHHDKIYK